MAHTISVRGAKVIRTVRMDGTRYHVVVDPQNAQFEMIIPYDQRMYNGLLVNFEGQIISSRLKFVRVQPSSVDFYGEPNV